MSGKKIIIHIGHGKTGSSAIQSFLAANWNRLKENGIDYPYHESFQRAKDGLISSGNPVSFFDFETSEFNTVLFSSESFFNQFKEGTRFYNKLISLDHDITILCFTRDIIEHLFSSYGQFIKRGKGTTSIEMFAERYSVYSHLCRVLELASRLNLKFILRNYSHCKNNLENVFTQLILGDKAEAFLQDVSYIENRVNRSLTLGELEIQRLFNLYCDFATSNFISDPLVNNLPNIRSSNIHLSRDARKALVDRNLEFIDRINSYLPADEAINISIPDDIPETTQDLTFDFTAEQLNLLVHNICTKLSTNITPREGARVNRRDEANILYKAAMKYENNKRISKSDALSLLRLAHKAWPNGIVIKKKLDEWDNNP